MPQNPPIPWMATGKHSASKNVEFTNLLLPGQTQVEKTYIRYGDFEFDAAIDLKFQVEAVYDSAGVLPKFYKHTFTIETVVTPANYLQSNLSTDQPVDTLASQMRRMLAVPGRRLWIYAKGVGQNQRMSQELGTDRMLVTDASVNETGINNLPFGHPGLFPQNTSQDPTIRNNILSVENTPQAENSFFFKVEEGMDMNYGPKPVVQIIEMIGSSRAYRLVWSVEVCLPICCVRWIEDSNKPGSGKFCLTPGFFNVTDSAHSNMTEFTYGYSWDIDDLGYTNLTISGSAEFAGRLFTDDSDSFNNPLGFNASVEGPFYHTRGIVFSKVKDALLATFVTSWLKEGFVPSVSYTTSNDNRRLDFRITYREVKSEFPYFKGIMDCNARTYVENEKDMSLYSWIFGISGSFTPFPGIPKDRALVAFLTLVRSRVRTIQAGGLSFIAKDSKGNAKNQKVDYHVVSVRFEEDIFSQKSSFSLKFRVTCDLFQILQATEVWKPIAQNTTWSEWSQAIPLPQSYLEGRSKVEPKDFTSVDESGTTEGGRDITGTCSNTGSFFDAYHGSPKVVEKPYAPAEPTKPIFSATGCPLPENSYLDYKVWFEISEKKPVVSHHPAAYVSEGYYQDPNWGDASIYANYLTQPSLPGTTPSQISAANTLGNTNAAYPTLQGMGAGTLTIRMKGYGYRYCGLVSPPALIQVNTVQGVVKPTQVASNCMINRTVNYGNEKLIFGAWDVTYALPVPLNANSNFIDGLLTNIEGEAYVTRQWLGGYPSASINPFRPNLSMPGMV